MSVANAAVAFPSKQNDYEFTCDSFTEHVPVWEKMLNFSAKRPSRILEIGSREGMSTVWLIENKLKNGDEFHVIDPWYIKEHEPRFDKNVELALKQKPGINFVKHKGYSTEIFPRLLTEGKRNYFDFIYVDGSHEASNVLEDLIFSNLVCKVGGLILCDDYLMPTVSWVKIKPKMAIDAFTNCLGEKLEILKDAPVSQIYIRKLSD